MKKRWLTTKKATNEAEARVPAIRVWEFKIKSYFIFKNLP